LNWVAFDPNLFRSRGHGRREREGEAAWSEGIAVVDELTPRGSAADELAARQRKTVRQMTSVVPAEFRGAEKAPVRSKCNHYSVKSRDVRNSDQRKIRRRFNNM
jgi:hypothetical protein